MAKRSHSISPEERKPKNRKQTSEAEPPAPVPSSPLSSSPSDQDEDDKAEEEEDEVVSDQEDGEMLDEEVDNELDDPESTAPPEDQRADSMEARRAEKRASEDCEEISEYCFLFSDLCTNGPACAEVAPRLAGLSDVPSFEERRYTPMRELSDAHTLTRNIRESKLYPAQRLSAPKSAPSPQSLLILPHLVRDPLGREEYWQGRWRGTDNVARRFGTVGGQDQHRRSLHHRHCRRQ